MTVTATGRRSAARPTRRVLWLPDADGTVGPAGCAGDGRLRWTACWSSGAPLSRGGRGRGGVAHLRRGGRRRRGLLPVGDPGASRHLLAPRPGAGPLLRGRGGPGRPGPRGGVRPITPAEVGIADGLFAAVLAARRRGDRPRRGDARRSWPRSRWASSAGPTWPSCSTAWASAPWASSPRCPTPTSSAGSAPTVPTGTGWPAGRSGELADLRQPRIARLLDTERPPTAPVVAEPGFWGGVSDTDARAARCLAAAQELLGPDGVVTAHLQGGRSPAERSRLVTWTTGGDRGAAGRHAPRRSPAPRGPDGSPHRPRPWSTPPRSGRTWPTPGGSRCAVSARGLLTVDPRPAVGGGWPVGAGVRLGRAVAGRRALVVAVAAAGAPGCRRSPHARPTSSWPSAAGGGSRRPTAEAAGPTMPYAELHAHSNFSFLDGASHPEELAAEAVRLGLSGGGPDRPQRALRGGPVRGGGPGIRPDHRVRRRAHPVRHRRAPTCAPGCPTRTAPTWWCWPATPRATPGSAGPSPRPTWRAVRRAARPHPRRPGRPPRWPLADPDRVPQGAAGRGPDRRGAGRRRRGPSTT